MRVYPHPHVLGPEETRTTRQKGWQPQKRESICARSRWLPKGITRGNGAFQNMHMVKKHRICRIQPTRNLSQRGSAFQTKDLCIVKHHWNQQDCVMPSSKLRPQSLYCMKGRNLGLFLSVAECCRAHFFAHTQTLSVGLIAYLSFEERTSMTPLQMIFHDLPLDLPSLSLSQLSSLESIGEF